MAAQNCTHFNGLAAGAWQDQPIAVTASKTSGQLVSLANPEQVPLIVTITRVYIKTGSAGACTLDIGCGPTNTLYDNLIDGISVNAAPNTVYDSIDDAGSNGKTRQYLGPGDYLTVSVASGDANGLVGNVHFNAELLSGGSPGFP